MKSFHRCFDLLPNGKLIKIPLAQKQMSVSIGTRLTRRKGTHPLQDPPGKCPSLASTRLPVERLGRRNTPSQASTHAPLSSEAQHVRNLRRVKACGFASCNRRWKKTLFQSRVSANYQRFSPLLIDRFVRSGVEWNGMFFFR